MNSAPIVFVFSDVESRAAFYSSPYATMLTNIAPSREVIVSEQDAFIRILQDSVNDFYCRTIIAIGKVFSDSLRQFIAGFMSVEYDMTPSLTAKGICHDRLVKRIHLLTLSEAHALPLLYTLISNYYDVVSGRTISMLAKRIGTVLKKRSLTIATAESCTGGLIVKSLTDIAGSSSYVKGGACTYTAAAKTAVLGVSSETIAINGVVSAETACAMAEGTRQLYDADIGVSTTGIAGPGCDADGNEEGLVWLAISTAFKTSSYKYSSTMHTHLLDRESIRMAAVCAIFEELLRIL